MIYTLRRQNLTLVLLFETPKLSQVLTYGGGNATLECEVVVTCTTYEVGELGKHKHTYSCLPMNHADGDFRIYPLELPEDFLQSHSSMLNEPDVVLSIPQGTIFDGAVHYPKDVKITTPVPTTRRLGPLRGYSRRNEGNLTMLIVALNGPDAKLSLSTDILRDRFFHQEKFSLSSQMNKCSFGKANIVKAQGFGIDDGVVHVDLDYNPLSDLTLTSGLFTQLSREGIGIGGFDFVAWCLPPGPRFIANADTGHPQSRYSDAWCGEIGVLMHEVGHNMFLRHSGDYKNQYADITGQMGFASRWSGNGPERCYNAAKHYNLGWFEDRTVCVDDVIGHIHWGGRLATFVDYNLTSPEEFVIIRIGDIYMQYNRAKSFNVHTGKHQDQVVIVHAPRINSPSILLAGISAEDPSVSSVFRYKNFTNGVDLIIEACEQVYGPPDYVQMSLHLDNGIQSSTCDGIQSLMPSSSSAPSRVPTTSPSVAPSTSVVPTPFTCEDPPDRVWLSPDRSLYCVDIARRLQLRRELCHEGLPAYELCPDACRQCLDHCDDDYKSTFYVDRRLGVRNCAWLSYRLNWQPLLCHPGHDAYHLCRDTCESCERALPTQAPSTSPIPSAAPSDAPTAAPTDAPCEDSDTFLRLSRTRSTNCAEIAQSEALRKELCHEGQEAYDFCPDACGKCIDHCHDDYESTFFVSNNLGVRNCAWLSIRPHWKPHLCVEGKVAYRACRDTCDTCNKEEAPPTKAPSKAMQPLTCDDSKNQTFFIDESRGSKPCSWLARAPAWQRRLCVPGHEAFDLCPETCGKCSDTCEDTTGTTFHVNRISPRRDCAWLSVRPKWQAHLCKPGKEAFDLCPETCDTC